MAHVILLLVSDILTDIKCFVHGRNAHRSNSAIYEYVTGSSGTAHIIIYDSLKIQHMRLFQVAIRGAGKCLANKHEIYLQTKIWSSNGNRIGVILVYTFNYIEVLGAHTRSHKFIQDFVKLF